VSLLLVERYVCDVHLLATCGKRLNSVEVGIEKGRLRSVATARSKPISKWPRALR